MSKLLEMTSLYSSLREMILQETDEFLHLLEVQCTTVFNINKGTHHDTWKKSKIQLRQRELWSVLLIVCRSTEPLS